MASRMPDDESERHGGRARLEANPLADEDLVLEFVHRSSVAGPV